MKEFICLLGTCLNSLIVTLIIVEEQGIQDPYCQCEHDLDQWLYKMQWMDSSDDEAEQEETTIDQDKERDMTAINVCENYTYIPPNMVSK